MSDNTDQIEYWNGQAGERWVTAQDRLDRMLDPLSETAIERADPQPGYRVLDVGCGCGATSIAMAQRDASVWGIDISAPMLARARQRAQGVGNVAFSQTDAATQSFTPDHQLVFSRFGVMFFADPVVAFVNMRTGLAPDGRLVFLCWQAPSANPWVSVSARAIQPFLPAPDETPDPRAPGPFAFADETYVRDILSASGYADIQCDVVNATLKLGDTLDEALEFQGQIGPVSRVLGELDESTRAKALDAARNALTDYAGGDGVQLEAACWLVSATG